MLSAQSVATFGSKPFSISEQKTLQAYNSQQTTSDQPLQLAPSDDDRSDVAIGFDQGRIVVCFFAPGATAPACSWGQMNQGPPDAEINLVALFSHAFLGGFVRRFGNEIPIDVTPQYTAHLSSYALSTATNQLDAAGTVADDPSFPVNVSIHLANQDLSIQSGAAAAAKSCDGMGGSDFVRCNKAKFLGILLTNAFAGQLSNRPAHVDNIGRPEEVHLLTRTFNVIFDSHHIGYDPSFLRADLSATVLSSVKVP
jgi:hypothetical protein